MIEELLKPVAWTIYVLVEVIPYLVRESARALWGNLLWMVLAALVTLCVWKVLDLVFWVVRKAWVVVLVGAVLAVAGGVVLR